MGCFLGGVHDRSPKLLCPLHIWLPLPGTSEELNTQGRTVLGSCSQSLRGTDPGKVSWILHCQVPDTG